MIVVFLENTLPTSVKYMIAAILRLRSKHCHIFHHEKIPCMKHLMEASCAKTQTPMKYDTQHRITYNNPKHKKEHNIPNQIWGPKLNGWARLINVEERVRLMHMLEQHRNHFDMCYLGFWFLADSVKLNNRHKFSR